MIYTFLIQNENEKQFKLEVDAKNDSEAAMKINKGQFVVKNFVGEKIDWESIKYLGNENDEVEELTQQLAEIIIKEEHKDEQLNVKFKDNRGKNNKNE